MDEKPELTRAVESAEAQITRMIEEINKYGVRVIGIELLWGPASLGKPEGRLVGVKIKGNL